MLFRHQTHPTKVTQPLPAHFIMGIRGAVFLTMALLALFLPETAVAEQPAFNIMGLQMKVVKRSGEEAMAMMVKNYDQALLADEEIVALAREMLKGYETMSVQDKKIFAPTADSAAGSLLSSLMNIAYLNRQKQKYEEAEKALDEAMVLAKQQNNPVKMRQCRKEAAELKWARKSFLAASILFESILRDMEPEILADKKLDAPETQGIAANQPQGDFMAQMTELSSAITNWGVYIQLAGLYTYMSDAENALRIYQLPGFIKLRNWLQYKASLQLPFDENSPFAILNWASSMFPAFYHIGKGLVLNRFERYQEALTEFASASVLIGGKSMPEAQISLANLKGFALQKLGKLDEAIALYREGIVITASTSSGIREISECYGRIYLIDALIEKNELTEAMQQVAPCETLGRTINDPRQLWDILFLKGKILQKQGKLEEAYGSLKEAINLVETFRAQLSLERLKRDYMATKTKAYEIMVQVLLSLNRPGEALAYVERAKARAFVDLFGTIDKTKFLKSKDAGKVQEEFKELDRQRRRIEDSEEEVDRQLRGVPGAPADKRGLAFIQKLSQESGEFQKQEDRLAAMAGPDFAALSTVKPADIGDLAAFVDESTVLAEYYFGPSTSTVYVFALDAKRLAAKDPLAARLACPDRRLNFQIRDFRNLIEASPGAESAELHDQAKELYKMLVLPFESLLTGKKRLIIVPHGNLNFLPFSALENAEGKNLIDLVEIVFLPSASTLPLCRAKNPKKQETLFAFAFGDAKAENLTPLPNTVKEVDAIGNNFAAGKKIIVKSGALSAQEFATQTAMKDIVHLATHGVLNPNFPLESAIMFGARAFPVKDVMSLDLHASLITLSACQTGIGKWYEGDEIVGLTRAFMYAGTPSVLSSLWPVSDESTALLMSEFFSRFKKGMTKAQALQSAQIAVRAKFPSPYHWASFILTGDWQ